MGCAVFLNLKLFAKEADFLWQTEKTFAKVCNEIVPCFCQTPRPKDKI